LLVARGHFDFGEIDHVLNLLALTCRLQIGSRFP